MKTILVVLRLTRIELKQDTKYQGVLWTLHRMGYIVKYTFFDGHNIMMADENGEKIIYTVPQKISVQVGYVKNHYLCIAINKLYSSGFQTDFCYVRNIIAYCPFVTMMKSAKMGGSRIIVEIPTYPVEQEMLSDPRIMRRWGYRVARIFEKMVSKYVDLYVVIGADCNCYMGRPAINIENGIDVTMIERKKSPIHQDELHILALAKMARWHAYDRLIEGLSVYKKKGGKVSVFIHIVGNEGDGSLAEWKKLTDERGLNDWVIFEGPLYGIKLNAMFEQCDIGCASLGSYRKKMELASSLKVREFCSRGLPILYAERDRMLDTRLPYWHQIENDDTPVNMQEVIEFWDNLKHILNLSEKMNAYAYQNMRWEAQLEKIFQWFEEENV